MTYAQVNAAQENPDRQDAWPSTPQEAVSVQNILRAQVRIENDFEKLDLIAGVDVSYDVQSNLSFAFVVLMKRQDLRPLVHVRAELPTTFPYVPGFLSFREAPVILKALDMLPQRPDLLMVDGQGIAHPRRFGIAAHLGVLADLPAIGVAKSRLCGRYVEPDAMKGSIAPLLDKNERIGTVLRSKEKTNVLFISPGHRVDQDTALEIALQCLTKYRLPEPTRIADKLSKTEKTVSLL